MPPAKVLRETWRNRYNSLFDSSSDAIPLQHQGVRMTAMIVPVLEQPSVEVLICLKTSEWIMLPRLCSYTSPVVLWKTSRTTPGKHHLLENIEVDHNRVTQALIELISFSFLVHSTPKLLLWLDISLYTHTHTK